MTAACHILPAPGGVTLAARALELAGLREGDRILDAGCGSGEAVAWMRARGYEAIGADRRPRARRDVPLLEAQAESLPFAAATFDGVLAACSLSVTASPETALGEFARVLAPSGKLLITDLYARHAAGRAAGIFGREELIRRLAAHGFRTLVWEDRSDALRHFVAAYIFEHGSAAGLWGCSCAKPGYFLLVAQKKGVNFDAR